MPIHPTAVIDPSAQVHETADIGPYVVIEADCVVGEGCVLMAGAVLRRKVRMGRGNRVHAHAVLGDDPQYVGFDASTDSGLVIGDDNTFREAVTIHRGYHAGTDTVVGNGCYLMNNSHVAHDCVIANNVVMVNYAGVSGHCHVEDRAFISGHVGVHQFCRIGTLAMIGGLTGVPKDVPPYATLRGDDGAIVGINVVGLRRAGVSPEVRADIKRVFRELFFSGRGLSRACAAVRAGYGSQPIPAEVDHLLTFCETPSRRGVLTTTLRQVRGSLAGAEPSDD